MNGLSEEEVIEARKKYGNNSLIKTKKNSFFKLFIESLGDPIIRILIIALLIKIIFLFKDANFFETIGILASILIASLVSTISEYGSEAAFKKLEEESSKIKVKVLREKKIKEIVIDDVVVGDIVLINTGDKIPADGKIIKGIIEVDESCINGESHSKTKEIREQLYRGTIAISGECYLKIEKVGKDTTYGSIAEELQEEIPSSPLKTRLTHLAKTISKIGYLGALLVSLSYLFSKLVINNGFNTSLIINDISNIKLLFSYLIHAITLAVTVIVVSVPEGLPLMITLVLSSNMRRMLKEKVLVRKLVGIETAGNINYLLTDKTGTLTKGELYVNKIITSNLHDITNYNQIPYKPYKDIIYKSLYYNNSSNYSKNGVIVGGNSTDKALLSFIKENYDIECIIKKYIPFDSKNKYSAVILDDGNITTYIKGNPELIINRCNKTIDEYGQEKYFRNKDKILSILKEYTSAGLRVIALAKSSFYHYTTSLDNSIFIGLVIIKDELRIESKESISLIKKAGITPIMITGDDLNTARSIAIECGIVSTNNDLCLTSKEFNNMSDEEIIKYHKSIKVIARALPKDKSRLVRILEEQNYIVGMTGDGVNDAPALKKANVGFAMGSGTEVAKEASDIVILDDNIKSITKAILFGRTIFKSIRKFIIFQISVNICAVTVSIIGPLLGVENPITIVQMLWINMIMDTLAGIAFSYEPPLEEYMEEPPITKKTPIINKYMKTEIIFSGLYQAIICILFLKMPFINNIIRYSIDNKYLMTSYFTLFVFMGVFNAFNARTERLNILTNLKNNKVFTIIIISILISQLFIIYKGGDIFRTYGLIPKELFLVITIAISIIPADWIRKLYLKHIK